MNIGCTQIYDHSSSRGVCVREEEQELCQVKGDLRFLAGDEVLLACWHRCSERTHTQTHGKVLSNKALHLKTVCTVRWEIPCLQSRHSKCVTLCVCDDRLMSRKSGSWPRPLSKVTHNPKQDERVYVRRCDADQLKTTTGWNVCLIPTWGLRSAEGFHEATVATA